MENTQKKQTGEDGFVLVAVIATLVPMLLMVAAFGSAMSGKTDELTMELDQERALMAADAGVDHAIFRGRVGALMDGDDYWQTLGGDLRFRVEATYLMTDGLNNDNDSLTDEADEDVFQVIVTGAYRNTTRRVAAYLGPVPLLPLIQAGVVQMNPNVEIEIGGSAELSGHDLNLDGSPSGLPSQAGLAITPPGAVVDLTDELTGGEEDNVVGAGPAPSVAVGPVIDIVSTVATLQNIADNVLTSGHYSGGTFGSPTAPEICYRNGNLFLNGGTDGAGVLLVTGNLRVAGNFRYDGVIIVLGDIEFGAGSAEVFGAIIQGPDSDSFESTGNLQVNYSSEGIGVANDASGLYVAYNGWQELSR